MNACQVTDLAMKKHLSGEPNCRKWQPIENGISTYSKKSFIKGNKSSSRFTVITDTEEENHAADMESHPVLENATSNPTITNIPKLSRSNKAQKINVGQSEGKHVWERTLLQGHLIKKGKILLMWLQGPDPPIPKTSLHL